MGRPEQPTPPPPSAAAEPPKRKKKGRPSLLDIQKRLLKQQKSQSSPPDQGNPNPSNPIPAPNCRNSRPDGPCPSSDDDDERLSKKHRLLQGIGGEDPDHSLLDGREVLRLRDGSDNGGREGIQLWAGVGEKGELLFGIRKGGLLGGG